MSVQSHIYFVVVNDNLPRDLAIKEKLVIAREYNSPEYSVIFDSKDEAKEELKKLRNEHDNPDLNLYKMELTPIEA